MNWTFESHIMRTRSCIKYVWLLYQRHISSSKDLSQQGGTYTLMIMRSDIFDCFYTVSFKINVSCIIYENILKYIFSEYVNSFVKFTIEKNMSFSWTTMTLTFIFYKNWKFLSCLIKNNIVVLPEANYKNF